MGIIRPATPGFLITCVATGLLAVVSFCVPYFQSVYFLKANISVSGHNGTITFGTLGYCLELSNGTSCSTPSVGYELDINSLVGNSLPIQIPQVAVKWLTYCLVLHIVALGLAAISALFGLLAHVREMSMTCFSTCISGFAASIALLAFIFDIALFFSAKARINSVGSAEIGNATWLTLAAWVLLFFSGCFYTVGRCCISNRAPRKNRDNWDKVESIPGSSEAMRLDAVKAEADRKARQNKAEGGLPAFHEVQPLTAHIDGDKVVLEDPTKPDTPSSYSGRPVQPAANGGYLRAAPGTRAVDDYHSPARPEYAQNNYSSADYAAAGANRQPTSQHDRTGTNYTSYDHDTQQSAAYNHDPYSNDPYSNYGAAVASPVSAGYAYGASNHYQTQTPHQNERSYSLGGNSYANNGYGASSVPPIPEHQPTYFPAQATSSPPPIDTNLGYAGPSQTSPVKGPRSQNSLQVRNDESPPTYEAGTSGIQGAWGKH
ncbi:hypothetical protein H0H93_002976 [Arthromyces matolae]|nr:hypothetical protein H0H93_002976 [Arthromyces matolae]